MASFFAIGIIALVGWGLVVALQRAFKGKSDAAVRWIVYGGIGAFLLGCAAFLALAD